MPNNLFTFSNESDKFFGRMRENSRALDKPSKSMSRLIALLSKLIHSRSNLRASVESKASVIDKELISTKRTSSAKWAAST